MEATATKDKGNKVVLEKMANYPELGRMSYVTQAGEKCELDHRYYMAVVAYQFSLLLFLSKDMENDSKFSSEMLE